MILIIILYILCGSSVLIILIMLIIKFDYNFLILFEFYTLIFVYLVLVNRGSYERGNASVFLIVFRYVIGIGVVISNDLIIISFLLLMLGISKLPMYGLHIWLPKVHVEASILGSIVLAGAVLKLRIVYM